MAKSLSTLAVGATFEVPVKAAYQSLLGSTVVFKMADKNHAGYPASAITLITDKIISMRCFDAKEPSNSDSNRKNYGNNRYSVANIIQWLNSNAGAGGWYSAQHGQDAIPNAAGVSSNAYDAQAGFLAMLDDDFVAALMNTTVTVAKNTVTDGGSYETKVSKMFLASTTEVGLANENGIAEGSKLALFSSDTSRLAYCTQQALNNTNDGNKPSNTTSAWYWWLRTPCAGYSYSVRSVSTSGALYDNGADYGGFGVRPLCNLKSDILVSDNVNASGNYVFQWNAAPPAPSGISVPTSCYSRQNITVTWGASVDPDGDAVTYVLERSVNNGSFTQVTVTAARTLTEMVSTNWNTIKYRVKARGSFSLESAYITSGACAVIHNQPPAISGQNADLGTKNAGFTYVYTVTDPDNNAVSVVEAVDGRTLKSHSVTLGAQNQMEVTGNEWVRLAAGNHTLTVTTTDTSGAAAVRTMTFTKTASFCSVALAPEAIVDVVQMPRRITIDVTRAVGAGALFLVEVCNNAYDAAPTWEDATTAVTIRHSYAFINQIKTSEKWGVNIKVSIEQQDAIGDCWISEVRGNIE